MRTFETPKMTDFIERLDFQIAELVREFAIRIAELTSAHARSGTLLSSRRVLSELDAMDNHLRDGVAKLLGELRRALEYPELSPVELKDITRSKLTDLNNKIKASARLKEKFSSLQSVESVIDSRLRKAENNVDYWMRQFLIGWDSPVVPENLTAPPE